MKEIFYIQRDAYNEEGSDFRLLAVHETLEGAVRHFYDIVAQEREYYIGLADSDDLREDCKEDPDGTVSCHFWEDDGWEELFIHVFRKELLY